MNILKKLFLFIVFSSATHICVSMENIAPQPKNPDKLYLNDLTKAELAFFIQQQKNYPQQPNLVFETGNTGEWCVDIHLLPEEINHLQQLAKTFCSKRDVISSNKNTKKETVLDTSRLSENMFLKTSDDKSTIHLNWPLTKNTFLKIALGFIGKTMQGPRLIEYDQRELLEQIETIYTKLFMQKEEDKLRKTYKSIFDLQKYSFLIAIIFLTVSLAIDAVWVIALLFTILQTLITVGPCKKIISSKIFATLMEKINIPELKSFANFTTNIEDKAQSIALLNLKNKTSTWSRTTFTAALYTALVALALSLGFKIVALTVTVISIFCTMFLLKKITQTKAQAKAQLYEKVENNA